MICNEGRIQKGADDFRGEKLSSPWGGSVPLLIKKKF